MTSIIITTLRKILGTMGRLLIGLLTILFGHWQWRAPIWLRWINSLLARGWQRACARPKRSATIGVLLIATVAAGFAGYRWYQHLPKPVETTFVVTPPPLTAWSDSKNKFETFPLQVEFSDSAAPLDAIGQTVKQGIAISPSIAGVWKWQSDKKLIFQPNADWPVGAEFSVDIDKKKLLPAHIRLKENSFEFRTAAFTANIDSAEFYQDPVDPQLKKLVATVTFSHPVDTAEFEKHIDISLAKDAAFLGLSSEASGFIVNYDKQKLHAYVHSKTLTLPREDVRMTLTLEKGIRSARGGDGTAAEQAKSITVPGRYSLRFDNFSMTLVDNERFEPEQVLLMESTAPLSADALKGKIKAWLLPPYRLNASAPEKQYLHNWSQTEINREVLAASQTLPIEFVPGEDPAQTLHSFKFRAPVGRTLYVEVAEGVQAVGGSQSGKMFSDTVMVQPYPRSLKMLGDGAILSLTGERKVGFSTRGIEAVQIEVGRLLSDQLHQLVDVNYGAYAQPQLNIAAADRLVERSIEKRKLVVQGPDKPLYDSIDLASYLKDKSHSRYGIFLIKVSETNLDNQDDQNGEGESSGEPEYGYEDSYSPSAYGRTYGVESDSRLIVITDLGLVVKRELDGSQVAFVQSLRSGQPVEGAKVSILGRNGLSVQTRMTDASGAARFAPVDKLIREKTPLLFVVEHEDDMSFLPLNRGDRQLNFSRFDIGGIENNVDPNRLSTFLFSDRGIYRPGETVHIGSIVRTQDWKTQLNGVPVEMEVIDPRGMVLLRKKMEVGKQGFDEFNWSTQATSPTGQYQVSMYLIKNGNTDIQLGTTTVKVQEFEPDRMKVSAQLAAGPSEGWLTPEQVQASVKVMQLFGAPAAGRRVEGEMTVAPALPAFARYRDYMFFDRSKLKEQYQEKLASATTNDNGEAGFDLHLERFEKSTYRLSLLARAFEAEGGRNVASYSAALVSSAPYLVGIKAEDELGYLQRDSQHVARWIAIDQKLASIALADAQLEWVQRKFVSVLTKQNNGTYRYQSRRKDIVRDTKPFALAAGGSETALPTAEPGDFSLVLRDKDGFELNRVDYSVVGQANLSRSLERNAELQIKLDKKDYNPGETIELSIQAPYVGAGLITIERDRVYQHVWFKTTTTSSVQKIKLPDDFEGNGYINVQFLRDPGSDEIFMSPLSYGVVPFAVSLQHRTEMVKVETPSVIKPGSDLRLRVSTERPARVAVFAIDEGILQVAGYKKPEPLPYFFQKRMLDVRTAQILDMILPEFQQLLAAAAPGGDGDAALARHVNPFKRKNRPPTAYWSGIVEVDGSGKDLHYSVPDYFNGKLHVFAVAVTANSIGVFDGGTEVRGDLILSPNLPAMVAPGDEFNVSVSIFNNSVNGKTPISLQVVPTPGLTVIGDNKIQLTIAEQKEGVAQLRLRATETLGSADLKFIARGGDKQAQLSESVSVRPATPYRVQVSVNRQTRSDLTVNLSRDLHREYRAVDIGYGNSPLVWSSGLNAYLGHYPYSCTEQLVSQGIPMLLFGKHPELGKLNYENSNSADQQFDELIKALRSRQTDDGGFGLWSLASPIETLPSLHAVQFLVEAKERGYAVPADMFAHANQWLRRVAGPRGNSLDDMRQRAYAIYLLTRQGVVGTELLGTLQQELAARYAKEWPQDLTAAYVASSYRLLQKNDVADKFIKGVEWSDRVSIKGHYNDYYDDLTHDAQLLYLTARHFPDRLRAIPGNVMDGFGKRISANRYNSLSAANLLLAMEAYASAAPAAEMQLSAASIDKNGKATALSLSKDLLGRAAIGEDAKAVKLSKSGDLPAFYTLVENGFDRTVPAKEAREGIEIQREYLDVNGNAISEIPVGEEFLVRLRLRAIDADSTTQVAVVDLLPGGVEPVIERAVAVDPNSASEGETESEGDVEIEAPSPTALPIGVAAQSTWQPQFAEVRDDRMVLYGYLSRDLASFVYRVRATNAGVYQTPPPYAEGMYRRELYARGLAGKLTIVAPN
ncbi:MAG: alpha-2-macroglobulin [Spongiibacteraceae bacterium]